MGLGDSWDVYGRSNVTGREVSMIVVARVGECQDVCVCVRASARVPECWLPEDEILLEAEQSLPPSELVPL